MNQAANEQSIFDRVQDRPALSPEQVKETKPRELIYRFLAGMATSVAAGLVTLGFGSRVGGILLAFPAILAASLTLIEEEEDAADAREDARGAVLGALALAVFAAIGTLCFGSLSGGVVLALATAGWLASALLGYRVLWWP